MEQRFRGLTFQVPSVVLLHPGGPYRRTPRDGVLRLKRLSVSG